MKTVSGISLILVIPLISLSAYFGLSNWGIGCAECLHCHGRIGPAPAAQTVAVALNWLASLLLPGLLKLLSLHAPDTLVVSGGRGH